MSSDYRPFRRSQTVTMEAAGVLVGGTAEEIGAHIDQKFKRANELVDKLRTQLTKNDVDPDVFAPKVDGGVILAKLKATMHDTCNTANKSAVVVARLAATSGEEHFGVATWASIPEAAKKVYDHLLQIIQEGYP